MKNKKIILVLISIIVFIVLVTIYKTGAIQRIINIARREEIKKEITYVVYEYKDNNLKMLVSAEDSENGIETLVYPNNELQINCNGKKKVSIDYELDTTEDKGYTFLATTTAGENIEKVINVNDEFRQSLNDLISIQEQKESNAQTAITINYKDTSIEKQYRVGQSDEWIDYVESFTIDSYQIQNEGMTDGIVPIKIREVDELGYEIQVEQNVQMDIVTYNDTETRIEGESILKCVEENSLQSGNYTFVVNGEEYPAEVYNYEEDVNYVAKLELKIGNNDYNGLGSNVSDERMLVLKYNGNLTVGENIELKPSTRKKGMYVYVANTVENNGTISMTARGASAEGQDVYLWKNTDGSYEYVPAIGATGGEEVTVGDYSGAVGQEGKTGNNRQTGGGGSGGAKAYNYASVTSGKGGTGTSYSGGAGGGACASNGGTYKAEDGSSTGGAGGNANKNPVGEIVGGGAGNPAGYTIVGNNEPSYDGNDGTGGLLILYANIIQNNGRIESQGTKAYNNNVNQVGGSSGGGSVNVFYKQDIRYGDITAKGGESANGVQNTAAAGGAGGDGTVTIGKIENGNYTENQIYLYRDGDECTIYSGGWQPIGIDYSPQFDKSGNCLQVIQTNLWTSGYFQTNNDIDFSQYNKLKVKWASDAGTQWKSACIIAGEFSTGDGTEGITISENNFCYTQKSNTAEGEIKISEFDITELKAVGKIYLYAFSGNIKVYEVSLEK